jgi:iron complex transport system permease protein
MTIRRRIALTWAGFGAGAFVVCILAPLMGSTSVNFGRVFDRSIPFADNIDAQIFFIARLPRVLAGAMVGSSLAASGVVF